MGILDTKLLDLQANYPSQYDRQEWRRSRYGFVDSAVDQTNHPDSIISADVLAKSKQSEARALEIPVIDYKEVTITNARTCTVQPFENDSSMVQLTWKTLVFDITMYPQQYKKEGSQVNLIGYNEDLNKKLLAGARSMLAVMDQDLQIAVDAAKAQDFNSTLVGTKYPLNLGAIQASQAQAPFFFNDLQSIQEADDFDSDDLAFIGNVEWKAYAQEFMRQGPGNAINTEWVFDPFTFYFSPRIPQNAGAAMTGYYMPMGTLGFLTRIDGMAEMGYTATKGTEWDRMNLPEFPFEVGVKFDSDCKDLSSVEDYMSASAIENWQISLDFAICTPYFSGDIASSPRSIKKVELTVA